MDPNSEFSEFSGISEMEMEKVNFSSKIDDEKLQWCITFFSSTPTDSRHVHAWTLVTHVSPHICFRVIDTGSATVDPIKMLLGDRDRIFKKWLIFFLFESCKDIIWAIHRNLCEENGTTTVPGYNASTVGTGTYCWDWKLFKQSSPYKMFC